jgi:tetratricopeptide (TPR) repeat protein
MLGLSTKLGAFMNFKNLGLFVSAVFFSQILFAMEPIPPGDDFKALAQANNNQETIKRLNRGIESYNRNIKKGNSADKSYYLKAGALMELAVLKPDDALFSQALECLDAAITRQPYNAIYLIDRAKLLLKLGNKNLALQDIQKVKSI